MEQYKDPCNYEERVNKISVGKYMRSLYKEYKPPINNDINQKSL